jgi:hypothetical protein
MSKLYKTQGGLKRHVKRKHPEDMQVTSSVQKPTSLQKLHPLYLNKMINAAVEKFIKDECFPLEIREQISSLLVDSDEVLVVYEHFKPVIEEFRDPDKFFSDFYGLVSTQYVPVIFEKLGKEIGTLFCHELGNYILKHLVGATSYDEPDTAEQMSEKEQSVLEYLCGYICHKTFTKLRFSKHCDMQYHVQAMEILKMGKLTGETTQKFIEIKNRGGLWAMNTDYVKMFGFVENQFRKMTTGFITKIPHKQIVESLMAEPLIIGYFKGICRNVNTMGIDREIADSLLQTLLGLYVRVRSHAYAKALKEKHIVASKKKNPDP